VKGTPYFYHAVATNGLEEEKNTEEALKWPQSEGQPENFNKELKVDWGWNGCPVGRATPMRSFSGSG